MRSQSETHSGVLNYFIVTMAYWAFTLTDGAIRMLVVLYFHQLGYSAMTIATLFLFYEFFGVITNLFGGWLGSRLGINLAMYLGMLIQIMALLMLTIDTDMLTVTYVMLAQALSGIAKDLNKMGAKSSLKLLVPDEARSHLFKWVAILTGSKNALKGVGFFLGGLLLSLYGFQQALYILATGLFLSLIITMFFLPSGLGKTTHKIRMKHIVSKSEEINWLSAGRLFLFSSRDVWFVVGLPVFLSTQLGWSHIDVGSFFALWVIGYGFIQTIAPKIVSRSHHHDGPDGKTASIWNAVLLLVVVLLTFYVWNGEYLELGLITGLTLFAIVFALNSSIHSFLILNYANREQVAMDVGFYYMANATGRLVGTILSGWAYQHWELVGCLTISAIFLGFSLLLSTKLPRQISNNKRY
ncbi:MAG: organoarsenical effux MFS transporter ArsJ [Gammaproteobacteria bacterium]|nr:organoarsenical effux MFS transporter ArsJ [Gammaproteobacteria bacterium]